MDKIQIQAMIKPYRIVGLRNLTQASYVLRFDRNGMNFRPGQHLVIGKSGNNDAREYSIYSGKDEDFLEILVRKVEDGLVSKVLHDLKPGDYLDVDGPFGFFMTNAQPPGSKNLLFIASGTGIAPFHSFVRSFPDTRYKIIHGIRTIDETYDKETYKKGQYISSTSRDDKGDFHGRLTAYLRLIKFEEDMMVFLCGNSDMIFESIEILHERGFSNSRIFTEVYF